MTRTKKLTLCSVLTAMAFTLTFISKQLPAPWAQGGYISIGCMVPIILVSILLGTKWGLASGFILSLFQLMTDFYLPPVTTFLSFLAVIFLDYIFAFTVPGFACVFMNLIRNKTLAIPLSGTIVTVLRYILHVISGILVWGAFVDTDCIPLYALIYNGSYMIPEIVITTVILAISSPKIIRFSKIQKNTQN